MKKITKFIASTLIFTSVFSTVVFAKAPEPELIGTSALAVDLETNEIIYAKNIDKKMYPASITKLMTALLLAENKSPGDLLNYPEAAKNEAPYSYGLNVHPVNAGDTFTASNAMDILLLYSGNDIAYMIAENVGGSVNNFVKMMNEKAKELKMTNTHFVTPNGLDDNTPDHLTTAYDLSILLKAIMSNDWTKSVINKKEASVQSTKGPVAKIENRNKLLGINGNIGGKTGYTDKSGRCLVSVYERENRKIATVVLNSEYDYPKDTKVFEDMEKLADYSYSAEKELLLQKDSDLNTITLKYNAIPLIGPERAIRVPVTIHEDITYYDTEVKPEINYNVNNLSAWKLNKDKSVGQVSVKIKNSESKYDLYPTISKLDIIKENILIYSIMLIVIISLIVLTIYLINKKKRSKRRYTRYY
ncbi:D-alanyl-D-alanine carboxypeptidase family protein [Clostridium argentinense CDC 2741]|uniref:D-alanyl-D-alanine carboxypeptidase family protein n=1 Tax=Clostridium argentinense CDC 2741 TaxID=1418104 RepID=A0A0C1U8U3_9CLOT|nr:D-alanyl-D-alanine carboxypeptidase family protein [Clostridium argentinense]ARC85137.1 phosphatase [Clostridium argentinense]KIE48143.1 D-alanyl-D-alanine carboxypeptidase family protein [Clostridium argentinense CDC 2741]NFF39563.1 D-alanyl-D-alanine carboxypeptidase [Clostridium argentinense]NFP51332.1 D-alanyl-D-alanine carboxypeptidase [Clostridium argentinense]NFP72750.1 D-alanyl-D-alanine carboxypeptidase [Clostridium argentinense]